MSATDAWLGIQSDSGKRGKPYCKPLSLSSNIAFYKIKTNLLSYPVITTVDGYWKII